MILLLDYNFLAKKVLKTTKSLAVKTVGLVLSRLFVFFMTFGLMMIINNTFMFYYYHTQLLTHCSIQSPGNYH